MELQQNSMICVFKLLIKLTTGDNQISPIEVGFPQVSKYGKRSSNHHQRDPAAVIRGAWCAHVSNK